MEITNNLEKYIGIFDDVIPSTILESFSKICKESEHFKNADIIQDSIKGGARVDTSIRKTLTWPVASSSKKLTDVHWAHLFRYFFNKGIEKYLKDIDSGIMFEINDVQILKYTIGGHYKIHVDHASIIPRTISCIFLVNDDYKGGELVFKFPSNEKFYMINKVKNRMIIWPSNFLYPHSVLPVTEGERYSVVAWAL